MIVVEVLLLLLISKLRNRIANLFQLLHKRAIASLLSLQAVLELFALRVVVGAVALHHRLQSQQLLVLVRQRLGHLFRLGLLVVERAQKLLVALRKSRVLSRQSFLVVDEDECNLLVFAVVRVALVTARCDGRCCRRTLTLAQIFFKLLFLCFFEFELNTKTAELMKTT